MLGPLSVRTADEEVAIAAGKQRVVLAALLVRANRVVSFDELASAVWDCAPPASSRVTLRNYVKCLRQILGPTASRLVTRDPGYLIRLGPDELDMLRFRALCERGGAAVRQADWERAAAEFAEALALWRGTPLADIPSDQLRLDVVPGLERLRCQATEWRIDADLHLGRHEDLVLELQVLVAEQPLRERFHAQLMLALYRSGRAAEALAAYEQARQVLADQLGADPGPELRRLHELVLRSDPGLAGPPKAIPSGNVPRQLPAAPRCFVGRAAELTALHGLADRGAGETPISVIGGTAGVGKTALALHFAHEVTGRFPDGQLYVNLRGFDPAGPPVTPAEAIRDFLAALGADLRRVPPDVAAQAALYRSMIAGQRLLILLDNARDAGQVRPLLPGGAGCLVIVTSRRRLTGLVAADGAHPLTLDLLTPAEARELLRQRLGAGRLGAGADEIITLCARLPLALSIAAAQAATRPALPLSDLAAELHDTRHRLDGLDTGDAPSSVRAVFSWSYQGLSSAAARLFRLLGVHPGPDISPAAAASLAGLPIADVSCALTELVAAHLVAEHVPGRFAFHDLLRAYAADQASVHDSPAERRAAIRRTLDHCLHAAYAADRLLIPARDPITLDDPAPGVCPEARAGCGAALTWFRAEHAALFAAVGLAAEYGFGRHAWQLAWALSTFLERQGHWRDWAATQNIALSAALDAGDQPGQAHAHRQLGRLSISSGRYTEAGRHLWPAIEGFRLSGDLVGEARTRLDVARALEGQGVHREAIDNAAAALELFRFAGHGTGQARALNGIGWCYAQLGEYSQTLAYCRQALDLHRDLGYHNGEAATLDSLGFAHHHLGHYTEAIECYRQGIELCRTEGDRYGEADGLSHLGDVHADVGDLPAARRSWQPALTIMDDLSHPDGAGIRVKLENAAPVRPNHSLAVNV
jgi:DNA-binding SARP family transcriptional activator